MKNKLNKIDEILISFEDFLHGKDGENCTKARKLLMEVQNENKKFDFEEFKNFLCYYEKCTIVEMDIAIELVYQYLKHKKDI